MSEMSARMTTEWVKEEILDAVSDRFYANVQQGMTLAEENAWRRQQRRVAKFLGFSAEPVAPASGQVRATGKVWVCWHCERRWPDDCACDRDSDAAATAVDCVETIQSLRTGKRGPKASPQ